MNILANDGIAQSAKQSLEAASFTVFDKKVAQDELADFIEQEAITVLLVRSATKVDSTLIDASPTLKLIGRAGVGLDNIDLDHAKRKGVTVFNTPNASSRSVAELVFAHLFTGVRFLHDANRQMPLEGDQKFKELKKSYSAAKELKGKTLGIIGFGRIGQEVARMAFGLGMDVIYTDQHKGEATITLSFINGKEVSFDLKATSKPKLLNQADFISIHTPSTGEYVIGKAELAKMRKGTGIINTARGGVLDEVALVKCLDSGKIAFAGLDVFESEPQPEITLLMHPKISLSPHIGASTVQAQERIGEELVSQIINLLGVGT